MSSLSAMRNRNGRKPSKSALYQMLTESWSMSCIFACGSKRKGLNNMGYTQKSEETLIKEGLIQDGIYDFEVVETSDKKSSKGNDMYTLKLHIFIDDMTRIIFDYISLGNNFGERKLRHAAD